MNISADQLELALKEKLKPFALDRKAPWKKGIHGSATVVIT